ncbi:MAG: SDR family NAD(P)-dependent oxidoreductase [Lachnospiraceae bacterium]|nr:SDR family NAD(P)-dependent oxidoreductase [Lachnospiraceae bacterium]
MKIAVVTGASSGLGKEFVKQIALRYRTLDEIWVLARRTERLLELSESIKNVRIRCITCDITDKRKLLKYRNALKKYNPSIRVLVNAAGYGIIGKFDELSEADNVGMVELNSTALTRMIYISLPYMSKGGANIINMASSAAFLPQPSFAVYAASKSYVLSLSRALNQELKKRKIKVTAVCPGPVATEFFDIAEVYNSVKLYKKVMMAKADKVAALALRDAYHGKTVSVYGGTMKAFRLAAKILPQDIIIRFIK